MTSFSLTLCTPCLHSAAVSAFTALLLYVITYINPIALYLHYFILTPTLSHAGPNKHTITLIKDAVHDGLRAVKNAIEDGSVVPGAGAFEVSAHAALTSAEFMNSVSGRTKLGVKVRGVSGVLGSKCAQRDEQCCWLFEGGVLVESCKSLTAGSVL